MTEEELPSGWTMARLGDFLIERGQGIDPATAPDEEFELYSVPSFETGHAELLTGAGIGSSKQIVEPNTVLICKINPRINRAWRVRETSGRRQIASTEWICFPPSDAIEPDYLRLYLSREPIRAFLALNVSGVGGSLMRVRPSTLAPYPLPIAPLNEQRRIVERIDELFSQIEAGEAALARAKRLLARYRQAVLKAAVTGELTKDWRERHRAEIEPAPHLLTRILQARREAWERAELEKLTAKGKSPKDDSWKKKYKEPEPPDTIHLPELPEGWIWASLKMLTGIVGGITVDAKRQLSEFEEVPYLRVANVQRGRLDLGEVKTIRAPKERVESLLLQRGDLLLNEGGDRDKIGRGWVWEDQVERCIHQNHVFRCRPFLKGVSSKYLAYYANEAGRDYFFDSGTQTTNLASISLAKTSRLPVPVPPTEEIEAIVEACDDLTSIIDHTLKDVAELERRAAALRQAILTAAFAGKLVAQDPADEPAAALLDRIRAERTTTPATKPRRGRPPKPAAIAAQ